MGPLERFLQRQTVIKLNMTIPSWPMPMFNITISRKFVFVFVCKIFCFSRKSYLCGHYIEGLNDQVMLSLMTWCSREFREQIMQGDGSCIFTGEGAGHCDVAPDSKGQL